MKNMRHLGSLLAVIATMAASSSALAQHANYFPVRATVNTVAPSVTFTWDSQGANYTNGTQIFRRDYGEQNSPGVDTYVLLDTVPSPTVTYTDSTVQRGKTYEYRVRRQQFTNGATVVGARDVYFAIAVESAAQVDSRGTLLFVVESTLPDEFEQELQLAEMDLVGDGWDVKRMIVAPHDATYTALYTVKEDDGEGNMVDVVKIDDAKKDKYPHMLLKERIKAAYNEDWNTAKDESNVKALYLFGRVPVARSGNAQYDGHGSRSQETDVYYSDMKGTWTDTTMTINGVTGDDGNVPGDGKFDQSLVPARLEILTGRVDFAKMVAVRKNEREYLRDYIQKAHSWKHFIKSSTVPYRIYSAMSNEVYNAGAMRNQHYPITYPHPLSTGGWQPVVTDNAHLMAAALNYQPELTDVYDHKVMFNYSCGSYRQQWYAWGNGNAGNRMRMGLAQAEWGLTVCWGGRPTWLPHHMTAASPAGYMWMRLASNYMNSSEYTNIDQYGNGSVHINLLGDPTLRFTAVPPAKNVRFTSVSGANVTVAWDAAPPTAALPTVDSEGAAIGATVTSTLQGYHVYRSTERTRGYERLTSTLRTTASYSDTTRPTDKDVYYQVRAIYRTTVPTGVYDHQSQGVFNMLKTSGDSNFRPVANQFATSTKPFAATSNVPTFLPFAGTKNNVADPTLTAIVVKNPDKGQIRWTDGKAYYTSECVVQEIASPKQYGMKYESVGYTGPDSVTYRLWDGIALSDPVTIPINVVAPDDKESKLLVGWSFPSFTLEKDETWSFLPRTTTGTSFGWKYTSISNTEPGSTYNHAFMKPSELSVGSAYVRWINAIAGVFNHDAYGLRSGYHTPELDENGYVEWTITPATAKWQSLERIAFFVYEGNRGTGYNPDDKPTDRFKMELRASRADDEDFESYEVLPIDGVDSEGRVYSASAERNGGRIFSADLSGISFMQNTGAAIKFRLYIWDASSGYSIGIGKSADVNTGRSYKVDVDVWEKPEGKDDFEWVRKADRDIGENHPFMKTYDIAVIGTATNIPPLGPITIYKDWVGNNGILQKRTTFGYDEEITLKAPKAPDGTTYQWYIVDAAGNASPIDGATGGTYTLTGGQKNLSVTYYCELTIEGSILNTPRLTVTTVRPGKVVVEGDKIVLNEGTSNERTIDVADKAIDIGKVDVHDAVAFKIVPGPRLFGMSYKFTIQIVGSESGLKSISYQWFKNGKSFKSGKTIKTDQPEDVVDYICRVKSGAGWQDTDPPDTVTTKTYPVYETKIAARTSTVKEMKVKLGGGAKPVAIHYRAPITKSYTILMGYETEDKERIDPDQTGYGRMWGADSEIAFFLKGDTVNLLGQNPAGAAGQIGAKGLNIPVEGEHSIALKETDPAGSMFVNFTGVGTLDPKLGRVASITGFAYGLNFKPAPCPQKEFKCSARNHLNNTGAPNAKDANPDQGVLDRGKAGTLDEELDILGELLPNVYYPQPCYDAAPKLTPAHFFGTYTSRYNLALTKEMVKKKEWIDWDETRMKEIVDKKVPKKKQ